MTYIPDNYADFSEKMESFQIKSRLKDSKASENIHGY